MSNPNKARGTAHETTVVNYLREYTSRVFKPRQEGPDVGDIHVSDDFILQCKDYATWSKQNLYDWIDAAAGQAIHARRPWSAVVIKRRKGLRSSGKKETIVVSLSLQTFAEILQDLEEGRDAIAQIEE